MRMRCPSAPLLPALLLMVPAILGAQTTVHGTVVDGQTGAAVSGASVVVTGTTIGTVTDDVGEFTLTSKDGARSLTVSSVGYATKTITVSNPDLPLNIRLAPAPVRLPGIQVVSTKSTPSVGVLTQHDLQRTDEVHLKNAINDLPGVFMQSRTPWGGARITIRGYYPSTSGNSPNSNGLGYQVFLNDIPLTDASGVTILDDVDYTSIGNVEVTKGPASPEYGSYIGGAVRFTTERPTPDQTSFSQQVMSGRYGLLRTNTSFQTASNTSDLVLNYGYQTYDSFRPHSGSLKHYVRASGDFRVADNQTVSAYFAYNRSNEQLAGEIDSAPFYARDPLSNAAYLANDSHIASSDFLAGMTDHIRLSDRFTNQTTVFGTGRNFDQPFAHGFTDANQFNFGARSVFGYAGHIGSTGVSGSLGGMLQRSDVTTNGVFIIPAPPYPERPTDQQNYATNALLFTEWQFDLPARLEFTIGAGLTKNKFGIRNMLRNNQLYDTTTVQTRSFDAVLTPHVALSKQLGANSSVYASVSTGYTPPLLSNTVASDGTVDLTLKPERAVQYEIGTQGGLFQRRLVGQLALYDIENTDKLVTETQNSVTYTTNAGKQRNRGVEVSLSWRAVDNGGRLLSSVRPWITYSYTDAQFVDFKSDNNNNSGTVDFSGNAVPRVPKSMFSAGIDVATNSGAYLDGTYRFVDKVPVTFDNSAWVEGYHLLDLKVGYHGSLSRHWQLNVFAGGDNLTNSTYYSFLFVGPNIAGLATSAAGGTGDGYIIPAPYKATYYGSLQLAFRP
jgi:iron complex outermembrane receptor protein